MHDMNIVIASESDLLLVLNMPHAARVRDLPPSLQQGVC